MIKLSILFLLIYITACSNSNNGNTSSIDLSRARDAFDYPNLSNKSDTDIYIYQLKDTLSRADSFLYVSHASHNLKQFDEPNLSLKPLTLETFRFSYFPFFSEPINIT